LIGTALSSALFVAACDQPSTRTERAKAIVDATIDQITGGDASQTPSTTVSMESVGVMDRAIAGTIRSDINMQAASARSQFAIGSIIAKPKDVPNDEFIEEADLQDAELEEDATDDAETFGSRSRSVGSNFQPARAMPRVKIDPNDPEKTRRDILEARREMHRQADSEPAPRIRSRSLSVPDAVLMEPSPPTAGSPRLEVPGNDRVKERALSAPSPEGRSAGKKMARR